MQVTASFLSWSHHYLKIRSRLIQSKDKCRISAPILVRGTLNLPTRARKLAKFSLRRKEKKPLIVSNQCVKNFNVICAMYVECTTCHLHQRISKHKYSTIAGQTHRGTWTNEGKLRSDKGQVVSRRGLKMVRDVEKIIFEDLRLRAREGLHFLYTQRWGGGGLGGGL